MVVGESQAHRGVWSQLAVTLTSERQLTSPFQTSWKFYLIPLKREFIREESLELFTGNFLPFMDFSRDNIRTYKLFPVAQNQR